MSERPVVPEPIGQLIQPPVALEAALEAAGEAALEPAGMEAVVDRAVDVDLAGLAPVVAVNLAGLALVRQLIQPRRRPRPRPPP